MERFQPKPHCRFRFCPGFAWLAVLFLAVSWLAPVSRAQVVQPVSLVSVMVLYTPQAAAGAGGATALLKQIDQAVVEANTVFQNSRVNARIYLVKTASINYHESGSVSNDLARLRNPNDSVFKLAHQWRDQSAADLVCLVTETGSDYDFYGLQGPSADNAYSILRRPYLTGFNYLPVTLSFNFGCQLEQYYADSAGAFPYAYGYSFYDGNNNREYCTVESFYGERLPFFSNPDIQFDGQATGVPAGQVGAANNALVINQTAPIVAAFRGTALKDYPPVIKLLTPPAGAIFVSGTNLPLTVQASDADGKVVSVDYYFDATNKIASVSTAPFNTLWRNIPIGPHTLTAVAADNLHLTTVSPPVSITVLPANDNFASRSPVLKLPAMLQERNDLATAEPGEPDNNGIPAFHSLWWTWTAATNSVISVVIPDSSTPINLTVFTGTNFDNLTAIASNSTAFTFRAMAGASYQIVADSAYDNVGNVAFNLTALPLPANDDFAKRLRLAGSAITVHASNRYATIEPGEPAIPDAPSDTSLWWSWTAPADGQVTLATTSDSDYAYYNSLVVGVYTGNVLTNLTLVASQSLYNQESDLIFSVHAGVTYQIAMDTDSESYLPDPGPYTFKLNFVVPPPNDNFTKRTTISGSWIQLTNSSLLATLEPKEPVHAYGADSSIWWSWTAPASGVVTLYSVYYRVFDLYTGNSLTTLKGLPANTDGTFTVQAGTKYAISASGAQGDVALSLVLSTVRFTSPANGASYYLGKNAPVIPLKVSTTPNDGTIRQVEYFANGVSLGIAQRAPYQLNWRPTDAGQYNIFAQTTDNLGHYRATPWISISVKFPRPANDDFASRTRLQGTWLTLTNSNAGATAEAGEPAIAGNGLDDSIWWQWTAPVSGLVTLSSTTGAGFAVFTGTNVTNLTVITNSGSPCTFAVVAGTAYDICPVSWYGDVAMKLSLSNLKISHPADGAIFTNNSTISLQVTTTATEAPVRQVEYFVNGSSVGLATNAPYSLTWTNVPAGNYSLTAMAKDNLGHDRSAPPVSFSLRPPNDDFANRTRLQGNWISVTNSTANATIESGEPFDYYYYVAGSLWWQWTAPASGWVTLATPGYLAYLGCYLGDSVSNLQTVAGATGSTGFAAEAGKTYNLTAVYYPTSLNLQLALSNLRLNDLTNRQILFAGTNLLLSADASDIQNVSQVEFFQNDTSLGVVTSPPYVLPWTNLPAGDYSLKAVALDNQGRLWPSPTVGIFVVPANDQFTDRISLTGIPLRVQGTTMKASSEPGETNWPGFGTDRSVWYAWTAPATADYGFSFDDLYNLTMVSVFTGDSPANLQMVAIGTAPPWAPVNFSGVAGTTYQIRIDTLFDGVNFAFDLGEVPTNDFFADASPITGTNTTVSGDVSFATKEPGEPAPWYAPAGNSVWYVWTAPASGGMTLTISSGSSGYWGPAIGVYTGDTVSNLTTINSFGNFPELDNSVAFNSVSGQTYWISVSDGLGPFSLNFNFTPAPGNDLFANRTPLSGLSLTVNGTTRFATTEPGEANLTGYSGEASVWYAWTAPADGFVRLQPPQAFIGVFTGGEISDLTMIASGADYDGGTFDAVAGQTYPISVVQTPYGTNNFTWSLQMAKVAITNPVAGATFTEGTNLLIAASTIDLEGAVTSVDFFINNTLAGTATIRPFSMVLSNLALGSYALSAQATDEYGQTTVSKAVSFQVTPSNDNFASRIPLSGTAGTLTSTNNTATTEPGEYLPAAATGRTTWWTWTAPSNGVVTFTSNGELQQISPYYPNYSTIQLNKAKNSSSIIGLPPWVGDSQPLVSVYTGSVLTNLSLFASNRVYLRDYFDGPYSSYWTVLPTFAFQVFAGQTYQISLDGADYRTGIASVSFLLGPNPPPPPTPTNDDFARRTVLRGGSFNLDGTTVGATLELSDPDIGFGMDARTVWYSWTAPASGMVWMGIYPSYYAYQHDSNVGIFAGSSLGSLIPIATASRYNEAGFYALAGTSYQIEVADPSASTGGFTIFLAGSTPPMMFPTNAVRLSNGSYQIHVVGSVGQSFVIQSSPNQRDWSTIHTDTLQANSFDYTDVLPRTSSLKYYRVLPLDTVLNTQPFKMLAPSLVPAGGFALSFTGTSGLPIKIQTSTNLVNWYDLTSGVFINNAYNFTDYDAPNYPRRFYRSVQP